MKELAKYIYINTLLRITKGSRDAQYDNALVSFIVPMRPKFLITKAVHPNVLEYEAIVDALRTKAKIITAIDYRRKNKKNHYL